MYHLNFRFLKNPLYVGYLVQGFRTTLLITFFCLIFGFLLGLAIALCRRSKIKALRAFGLVWVDFLRNTPFLVQLFFFYYGLPQLGIQTQPLIVVIIALSINTSAVNCEAIRAGMMAIDKGYYEAALALGYSKVRTYTDIIIPIALRIAFKPLVNNFVNLVLTTSIAFSVTVMELMGAGKVINGRIDKPFEIYLLLLLLYCIITFIISFISKAIDKKIAIQL